MIRTFDLRKAQLVSQELNNTFNNRLNSVKWTEIYNNVDEIISDLKGVVVPNDRDIPMMGRVYSGYAYIHSFAKQLQSGKELSDKQITQCKRLALEIKKAKAVAKCWE